jgi:hypothetical protein
MHMFLELFRRHPGPRNQRATLFLLCSALVLSLVLGQVAAGDIVATSAAVLREQAAAAGSVSVRVDLRAAEDLEQTAEDLLFALPAGSYDAVQRTTGSSSLTLRVDAAGLDALLGSPLAAAVAVGGNPDMQRLAAGAYHSLAVNDGSVRAWGYGASCALGDGSRTSRAIPSQFRS